MRALVIALTACALAGCEKRGTKADPPGAGAATNAKVSVSHARYIANAGVMVVRGKSKILFDPLFREHFGTYQPLSEKMRGDLIAGNAPFDGVTAVFVSHHHGDHFDPQDIAALLRAQPKVQLFAPAQATKSLPPMGDAQARVHAVSLEYPDKPWTHRSGAIEVEAVRIPHAGWPDPGRASVENLAFRVTLDEKTTVLHLGDADTKDLHYAKNPDHWSARSIDMAFPPYWYFSSENGTVVLRDRLKPKKSVGVHVPTKFKDPAKRPPGFEGRSLFVVPGQQVPIPSRR